MARLEKRRQEFTDEFKRLAVLRMDTCENISDLAKELGLRRNQLYKWEAKLKGRKGTGGTKKGTPASVSETEQALREEIRCLREALGKRVQEIDFFKGALQKIEARRQGNNNSGVTASSPKSGR